MFDVALGKRLVWTRLLFSEKANVRITGHYWTMESAGAVKKRRIMIITDESLIEQIEKEAPPEFVQSIILESQDEQLTLSSTSVSLWPSSVRSNSTASSFSKASTADLPSTTANSKSNSRLCVICGSVAFSYSFDAWTCESCQAFFRRNALKNPVCIQHGG